MKHICVDGLGRHVPQPELPLEAAMEKQKFRVMRITRESAVVTMPKSATDAEIIAAAGAEFDVLSHEHHVDVIDGRIS